MKHTQGDLLLPRLTLPWVLSGPGRCRCHLPLQGRPTSGPLVFRTVSVDPTYQVPAGGAGRNATLPLARSLISGPVRDHGSGAHAARPCIRYFVDDPVGARLASDLDPLAGV